MSDSSKKICSVCGNECGISRFQIKNDGWCCRKCFDNAGLDMSTPIASMSAEKINELIAIAKESSTKEEAIYIEDTTKKPKNRIKPFIGLFLLIAFMIGTAITFIISDIENSPHNKNIERLEEFVGVDLADDVASALEKTASIKEDHKISYGDVTVCETGVYEIFTEITVRVVVEGNHFKLYTFYEQFDIGTPILLFDSSNTSNFKTLTNEEYDDIRYLQRKYLVESNIQISSKNTIMYSVATGTPLPAFEITIKNLSDKTIERVHFSWTDKERENTNFYTVFNTDQYFGLEYAGLPKTLAPGETRIYTIDMVNESYILKGLSITFTDGTEINFNEYDYQFLN